MARRKGKKNESFEGLIVVVVLLLLSYKVITIKQFVLLGIVIFMVILLIYKMKRSRIRRRYINSGIYQVDKMSGEEFERYLKCHFEKLGYKVELTPKSHDYGADLIMSKGGERIVIQAKRYKESVGIKAVQEIIGALQYYKADKGYVVTNSKSFTKSAIELANNTSIVLWARKDIIDKFNIKDCDKEYEISHVGVQSETNIKICPRCGKKMFEKKGAYGSFYGCSNYPKCKYTENM